METELCNMCMITDPEGRGLRLHEDKECLTVLDFVGNAHKNFNFEYRFRAMLGPSGENVIDEMEHGFPPLPAGCYIQLEKEAQKRIIQPAMNCSSGSRKVLPVPNLPPANVIMAAVQSCSLSVKTKMLMA